MTWLLRARALGASAQGARAGEARLLGPVDLDLDAGERVAVVGRSGAGKTQLVESLLDLPRTGVRRTGTVDWSPSSRPRGGLLAQESAHALDPLTRTGRQLGEGGLLAERLGLGPELLRRHPSRLSGGQRQRAALVLALARSPRLLVADEPTTGLDDDTRSRTLEALAHELDRAGTALLLVSHDLAAVRRVCTRVLVVEDGLVVESGPVDDVLTAPTTPAAAVLVEASRVLG